jgi:WXG100 family type VII secretion target
MMQFSVTPSALTQAAQSCTNANTEIQGQIQQVVNFIDDLLASGYQGPCATQLQTLATQWQTDATKLNTVLTEIAGNLKTNAANYSGGESQNTANLINVGVGLAPGAF